MCVMLVCMVLFSTLGGVSVVLWIGFYVWITLEPCLYIDMGWERGGKGRSDRRASWR